MNIRELRKSKNLTQAAFAQALGIKAPLITAYETGRRRINPDVIAKIKEVFDVDVDTVIKAEPRKTATKKKTAQEGTEALTKKGLIIQSPLGGEITPEEIRAKVGKADVIYVRVDENKAYWVKGKKSGSIDLW